MNTVDTLKFWDQEVVVQTDSFGDGRFRTLVRAPSGFGDIGGERCWWNASREDALERHRLCIKDARNVIETLEYEKELGIR